MLDNGMMEDCICQFVGTERPKESFIGGYASKVQFTVYVVQLAVMLNMIKLLSIYGVVLSLQALLSLRRFQTNTSRMLQGLIMELQTH